MIKVKLKLGQGDFLNGFKFVNANFYDGKGILLSNRKGSLPSSNDIQNYLTQSQEVFGSILDSWISNSDLDNDWIETTDEMFHLNSSTSEFVEEYSTTKKLARYINEWFDSISFQQIRNKLLTTIGGQQEIKGEDGFVEIIIETENQTIQKLPLHLWYIIQEHQHCDIAFSGSEFTKQHISKTSSGQVRILGVLGDSSNIDLETDKEVLNQLPTNIPPTIKENISCKDLSDLLMEQEGWDILYFAGHSSSEENNGVIQLNRNESFELEKFKHCLVNAIHKGLQIAIFNSCDGMELAQQLQQLDIPVVIVMRAPIPNYVAQKFMIYFLRAFSQDNCVSIYKAMRQARERLFENVENKYSCASWLPVMFVNPGLPSPTWKDLRNDPLQPPPPNWLNIFVRTFATAFISAGFYLGILRPLDNLKRLEQYYFDVSISKTNLLRSEEKDDRLLIITIDNEYEIPLPDSDLYQLLKKLDEYKNVSAIGLDFIREKPVGHNMKLNDQEVKNLQSLLKNNSKLIVACSGDVNKENGEKDLGDKAPPEVINKPERIGFIDIFPDLNKDQAYILRRQTLIQYDYSPCPNQFLDSNFNFTYSFSLQLARLYLEKVHNIEIAYTQEGYLKLGNKIFNPLDFRKKRFNQRIGFYDSKDDLEGYQILLNYRVSSEIAETITLKEFLAEPFDPKRYDNRIILIGKVGTDTGDEHFTPHGIKYGVFIHAHMVSQIISAVVDDRPLISFLPFWGDFIFVLVYSIVAIMSWRLGIYFLRQHNYNLCVALIIGSCIIFIFTITLSQGFYLPIVPTIFSIVGTIILMILLQWIIENQRNGINISVMFY